MKSNISAREQQIIQLIANEHNSREIAEQLYISEHTVMSHRKNLNLKLDVRNSAGLVRKAFEMGLLKLQIIFVLGLMTLPLVVDGQDIIYVDHQATATEDGTTWQRAYRTLNLALDAATFGDSIFISEGTYTPPDTGRISSFVLTDGLTIIGGFDPHNGISEYEDISAFVFNRVILSGDLGVVGDSSDNSFHVLVDKHPGTLAVGSRLIGVDVEDGLANQGPDHNFGGGILVRGGRLDMYKCQIANNGSREGGSGMRAEETQLNLVETTFFKNYNDDTDSGHGAAYLLNAILSCNACDFFNNVSEFGGGIYSIDSELSLIGSTFRKNTAIDNGGALLLTGSTKAFIDRSKFHENLAANGGALCFQSDSLTTIFNSIITLNGSSQRGGGIYLDDGAKIEVINSNINFNDSNIDEGDGIYNNEAECTIFNSIICCNDDTTPLTIGQNYTAINPVISEIGNSYVEFGGGSENWSVLNTTDLGGNIDVVPMFNWQDSGDTLSQEIDCSSNLINKGSNDYNLSALDYDGDNRIILDTIDIGAQEYQDDEVELIWTGGGDGVHWHDAANWSCLRVPTQIDEVILESKDDTIVIDTGITAIALEVNIRNNCTLVVKGDTLHQAFGKLMTTGILLAENQQPAEFRYKSAMEHDSASLLNHGIITILNDGIKCEEFCHISNTYEMHLNDNGIELQPDNCVVNGGLMSFNINSDQAILIGDGDNGDVSRLLVERSMSTGNTKRTINNAVTFHNTTNGEMNITGRVTNPNQMFFDNGIIVSIGSFHNEGMINMRFLSRAMVLGQDLLQDNSRQKRHLLSVFRNDGTINIRESQRAIIGGLDARLLNYGVFNGLDLWACLGEFKLGFEFCNYGEVELRD